MNSPRMGLNGFPADHFACGFNIAERAIAILWAGSVQLAMELSAFSVSAFEKTTFATTDRKERSWWMAAGAEIFHIGVPLATWAKMDEMIFTNDIVTKGTLAPRVSPILHLGHCCLGLIPNGRCVLFDRCHCQINSTEFDSCHCHTERPIHTLRKQF